MQISTSWGPIHSDPIHRVEESSRDQGAREWDAEKNPVPQSIAIRFIGPRRERGKQVKDPLQQKTTPKNLPAQKIKPYFCAKTCESSFR